VAGDDPSDVTVARSPRIQVLDLARSWDLGNTGAVLLAEAVDVAPQLRTLDLEYCGISSAGAAALARALAKSRTMECVNIMQNVLGAEGGRGVCHGVQGVRVHGDASC